MFALKQRHLVQRGILTQAQREMDSPHGFSEAFSPRHPAAVMSGCHSSSRLSVWKTGPAHNDSSSQIIRSSDVWDVFIMEVRVVVFPPFFVTDFLPYNACHTIFIFCTFLVYLVLRFSRLSLQGHLPPLCVKLVKICGWCVSKKEAELRDWEIRGKTPDCSKF